MNTQSPTIVVTSGEPAGIGPEICLGLASGTIGAKLIVLGDPRLLTERAEALNLGVTLRTLSTPAEAEPHEAGALQILPIEAKEAVEPGHLNPENASYVIAQLERAAEFCLGQAATALVTAPVQKSVITEAGIPFTGHTEWLAERTGAPQPVMMLTSDRLRVALATTHLPLDAVPSAITQQSLKNVITVLARDLDEKFGIERPRIMVLGLNPHAGESGTLGTEEKTVVAPVVRELSEQGLSVTGPVPADTAFTPDRLGSCDAVLAMYHDQGLPVIKALSFGRVVNVTLGLPLIRTSVDHGTALGLAGTGRAQIGSLRQAVDLAIELAERSL